MVALFLSRRAARIIGPVALALTACSESPPPIVTTTYHKCRDGSERSCIKPAADVVITDKTFSALVGDLNAKVNITTVYQRVRTELAGQQTIEALEYRACVACCNGDLTSEAYADFLNKLLPLLKQEQAESYGHRFRVEQVINVASPTGTVITVPRTSGGVELRVRGGWIPGAGFAGVGVQGNPDRGTMRNWTVHSTVVRIVGSSATEGAFQYSAPYRLPTGPCSVQVFVIDDKYDDNTQNADNPLALVLEEEVN